MTANHTEKDPSRRIGRSPLRGKGHSRALPITASLTGEQGVLWQQWEEAFRYYDNAARHNRLGYLTLRVTALIVGAVVTICAAVGAPRIITASLAATAVVAEGIQQIFQFQFVWISSRTTAETLYQHGFLYAAGVPPYDDPNTRMNRFAEFVSSLASQENSKWAVTMQETRKPPPAQL